MDRNGDGDVSTTEFLGSREQFRRIDTDGDGLIDVGEAERADQGFRKRP
jgi:Ca2+-binding EF-hand superfamily protein